ncbi:MAG: hypothetical protein C4335_03890 [Armatimonadota bacterium]
MMRPTTEPEGKADTEPKTSSPPAGRMEVGAAARDVILDETYSEIAIAEVQVYGKPYLRY